MTMLLLSWPSLSHDCCSDSTLWCRSKHYLPEAETSGQGISPRMMESVAPNLARQYILINIASPVWSAQVSWQVLFIKKRLIDSWERAGFCQRGLCGRIAYWRPSCWINLERYITPTQLLTLLTCHFEFCKFVLLLLIAISLQTRPGFGQIARLQSHRFQRTALSSSYPWLWSDEVKISFNWLLTG